MTMNWLYALALGYALGSVPFGLLLTRAFGAGDLRNIGSGNIGATNVLRTGRKGLAAATLLLDALKGLAAVYIAAVLSSDAPLDAVCFAALGALVGHCFPIWLRFRGGKGVATMLGVSLAFDWRIGLASALVWLAVTLSTRISSLGGMASAVAAPVAAFVIYFTIDPNPIDPNSDLFSGLAKLIVMFTFGLALLPMSALVVFQHRANIARLRAGTEPKIGDKTS